VVCDADASRLSRFKDGLHGIRDFFFERLHQARLTVSWSGPNIGKQTVPASAFVRMTGDNRYVLFADRDGAAR
jgi:hypothetical protein